MTEEIKYVTFEVSSMCNMDCGFCFSDWREQVGETSMEGAKRIISMLADKDLEAINFTGGEPLLRQDIAGLIEFAKQKGLTTILTTNGILLEQKIHGLAQHLDFVGLPLDSSEPEVHNQLRPTKFAKNHHQLVCNLMDLINESYPKLGVKVNTVVTKHNLSTIAGIGNLIAGRAMSWKLSHFIAGGYSACRWQEYSITPEQYLKVAAMCREAYPKLRIISSPAHERDDCCRIISSSRHLIRPTANGLEDMGDAIAIGDERIMEGFNATKNLYFLRKTYPSGDGK